MKTIILEEPGRFALADTPEPGSPAADQVLVGVRNVGICGTDLHAYRGKQPFFSYPRILGHELGVEILAVGADVQNAKPGDRCAVNPYLNCGTCPPCRRGKSNCCEKLQVLGVHTDGGMRERILLPASQVYPSAKLSLPALALVETLGIGCHAVNRAQPAKGERTLVVGAGPIGLTVLEFLRVAGADLRLLEISPARRAFARKMFPDLRLYEHADAVKAEELPSIVFDCTGNKDCMSQSFQLIVNGGKLVLVGLFVGDLSFHDPDFHRRETTLLASRNGLPSEHRWIIELLENGTIDTSAWISERAGVDRMIERFPAWLDPNKGVIKAVVDF